MPLSAEDKAEVQALALEANKAFFTGEAGKALLSGVATEAATQAATQAVATVSDTVTKLATKVDGLATPAAKPGDKKEEVKDDVPPAWAKPLVDDYAKRQESSTKEAEKATRSALIEKTLTDAKHGGMLATHKTFINSLHAAGVTKPEQVIEALAAYKAEMKAAGVEVKETVASPAGEGAKGPTPEDTEAAALERIQQNAKNRPGSLAEVGKPKA